MPLDDAPVAPRTRIELVFSCSTGRRRHQSAHGACTFGSNPKNMVSEIRTDWIRSWTEESSYLLGFWWADGYISFRKDSRRVNSFRTVFGFVNTDLELMEKIGAIVGRHPKIHTPNSKTRSQCYYINAQSKEVFDWLYSMTRTVRKSSCHTSLPDVPNHLFHHFIRGFFDGDGSIFVKKYENRHGRESRSLCTAFSAGLDTGTFLEDMADRIRAFVPLGVKKVTAGTSRKLQFNQRDSRLLCEWMYRDATIFMKRKKTVWDSFDKKKAAESEKYLSVERRGSNSRTRDHNPVP